MRSFLMESHDTLTYLGFRKPEHFGKLLLFGSPHSRSKGLRNQLYLTSLTITECYWSIITGLLPDIMRVKRLKCFHVMICGDLGVHSAMLF